MSASENKIFLKGNAGGTDTIKSGASTNGTAWFRLSLCTTRSHQDDSGNWHNEPGWHNVSMFGKLAQRAQQQIRAGERIEVEGRLTYQSHEGKTYAQIMASDFEVLVRRPRKEDGEGSASDQAPEQPPAKSEHVPAESKPARRRAAAR